MTEVWAIVGSRNFTNKEEMFKTLDRKMKYRGTPRLIVSGGAKGADTFAEEWAKSRKIDLKIYLPRWYKYGNRAGAIRNQQIVDAASVVFAFIEKELTPGTKITIEMARETRREFEVIRYD